MKVLAEIYNINHVDTFLSFRLCSTEHRLFIKIYKHSLNALAYSNN